MQEGLHGGFEQEGAGRLIGMILHGDWLASEVAEEVVGFLFRGKGSAVFTVKGRAGKAIRIGEDRDVRTRAVWLKGEAKEAFGVPDGGGVDAPRGRGPRLGSFVLEPSPQGEEPTAKKEGEPDVEKPGPGARFGPTKRLIEH